MTELGELVAMAQALDKKMKNKCPFCGKAPHGFGEDKDKEASDKVKSIPKDLGCDRLTGEGATGNCRYTTAFHHLICAKQCYAKIKTLVRMGSLAGYDINSRPNGMPLPTVLNKYPKKGRGEANFGQLSDEKDRKGISEQDEIAYTVMQKTKAQWHVGHHSFEIAIVEYDEEDDKEYLHTTSYDCEVIEQLLNIASCFQEFQLCKDEEGKDEFKQTMDALSKKIKGYLKKFATRSPIDSKPFFVSDRSHEYAKAVEDGSWPRR